MIAGMVCDVMTHPAYQGKGIFTRIGKYSTEQMKSEGLDVVTGYPIRPAVIPGHLKVGWKILFKMPISLRITGTRSLPVIQKFPSFFHGLTEKLMDGFYRCTEIFRSDSEWKYQVVEHVQDLSESLYSNFLNQWSRQQPISLEKTPEFLKWRLGAPGTQYRIVSLQKNGKIHGVLVMRVVDLKGIKTLALLDWMEDETIHIPRGLLSRLFREQSRLLKTDLIAIAANPTVMKKRKFLGLFLIPSPMQFTFILKNLSEKFSDEQFQLEPNWHLTWIDSDDL